MWGAVIQSFQEGYNLVPHGIPPTLSVSGIYIGNAGLRYWIKPLASPLLSILRNSRLKRMTYTHHCRALPILDFWKFSRFFLYFLILYYSLSNCGIRQVEAKPKHTTWQIFPIHIPDPPPTNWNPWAILLSNKTDTSSPCNGWPSTDRHPPVYQILLTIEAPPNIFTVGLIF